METSFSVLIVTYNQEKYISQALDSVLNQDLSYIKEIIISDDGSLDGTLSICNEYKIKYPNLIKILENNKKTNDTNITNPDVKYAKIRQNYVRGINACSDTDYIAILEGDDYWCEGKISKFVSILNDKPEIKDKYVMLFHKYQILKGENITDRNYIYDKITEITAADCIENYQVNNLSCAVYKTNILKSVTERFLISPGVDYPLNIMILEKGNGLFIPEIYSVYRISENGSWASMPVEMQNVRNILRRVELKFFFDKSLNKYFDKTIQHHIERLLKFKGLNNFSHLFQSSEPLKLSCGKTKLFSIKVFPKNDKYYLEICLLGIKIKFRMEKV